MAEQIALTAPFKVDPREATLFQVEAILLNWKDKIIVIHLGDGNVQKVVVYKDTSADPVATTLMVALNKANLSTKSLQKRILERLQTDGHLAGTISGTPD